MPSSNSVASTQELNVGVQSTTTRTVTYLPITAASPRARQPARCSSASKSPGSRSGFLPLPAGLPTGKSGFVGSTRCRKSTQPSMVRGRNKADHRRAPLRALNLPLLKSTFSRAQKPEKDDGLTGGNGGNREATSWSRRPVHFMSDAQMLLVLYQPPESLFSLLPPVQIHLRF